MSTFRLPFGMTSRQLMPDLLSASMTPGQAPGPVAPVQLQSGYRPPGGGGGGMGMNAPQMPETPGFNVQEGMGAMGAALRAGGNPRTAGDRDLNGYNAPKNGMTEGQDANGNPIMLPNPNAPNPSLLNPNAPNPSGPLVETDFLNNLARFKLGFSGGSAGDFGGFSGGGGGGIGG